MLPTFGLRRTALAAVLLMVGGGCTRIGTTSRWEYRVLSERVETARDEGVRHLLSGRMEGHRLYIHADVEDSCKSRTVEAVEETEYVVRTPQVSPSVGWGLGFSLAALGAVLIGGSFEVDDWEQEEMPTGETRGGASLALFGLGLGAVVGGGVLLIDQLRAIDGMGRQQVTDRPGRWTERGCNRRPAAGVALHVHLGERLLGSPIRTSDSGDAEIDLDAHSKEIIEYEGAVVPDLRVSVAGDEDGYVVEGARLVRMFREEREKFVEEKIADFRRRANAEWKDDMRVALGALSQALALAEGLPSPRLADQVKRDIERIQALEVKMCRKLLRSISLSIKRGRLEEAGDGLDRFPDRCLDAGVGREFAAVRESFQAAMDRHQEAEERRQLRQDARRWHSAMASALSACRRFVAWREERKRQLRRRALLGQEIDWSEENARAQAKLDELGLIEKVQTAVKLTQTLFKYREDPTMRPLLRVDFAVVVEKAGQLSNCTR